MLLGDDSDSEVKIEINENYASRYNSWRQKEELQKCKCKQQQCYALLAQIFHLKCGLAVLYSEFFQLRKLRQRCCMAMFQSLRLK
jgi:hypothetical protein